MGWPVFALDFRQKKKLVTATIFTLNVEEILGKDLGALVDRLARAVEHTAEHVLRDGDLEGVARELNAGLLGIDTRGTLKDLQKPPCEHTHKQGGVT